MGDNVNVLLSGIKWSVENDMWLSKFVDTYSLPHLALVTKGQYKAIGAPNVANPHLKPYVLVYSRVRQRKVVARLVKVKEGRRPQETRVQLAIPETHDGFFEIVSEEGKATKALETVKDLYKKFPDMCLLRQSCKVYLPDHDGELRNLDRHRVLQEGDILTLVGQFNLKRVSFLRCFDETGHSVYLKMSQKGKFSPVAKKDAITGVHYIRNLVDSKRLPLTVRFIQGSLPLEIKGHNGPIYLRLLSVFQDDAVMMYVLQKDWEFLSVPLNAHLKIAPSSNHPQIISRPEFDALCAQCDELLPLCTGRIVAVAEGSVTSDNIESGGEGLSQSLLKSYNRLSPTDQPEVAVADVKAHSATAICDEEIDQLYDYIRGLAPLPDTCYSNYKPAPPPLETLPSRKSNDSRNSAASRSKSPRENNEVERKRSNTNTHQKLKAEKRLDAVIYKPGYNSHANAAVAMRPLIHKRLSKSNDRLQLAVNEDLSGDPPPDLIASVQPKAGKKGFNHFSTPPAEMLQHRVRRKPRPVSMAVPDSIHLLPSAAAMPVSGEFYPVVPQYRSIVDPHQGLTNMHLSDDEHVFVPYSHPVSLTPAALFVSPAVIAAHMPVYPHRGYHHLYPF